MRLARVSLSVVLFGSIVPSVRAQTEEQLRAYFEGKSVRVRMEMPGTSQGVDVYPGTSQPIDYPQLAGRLKQYGTAFRRGDEAMITKIRVKKDLIEFQLGGGGFGTFGDDDSPYVSVPSATKTTRERNLEREVQATVDPVLKRRLREELDRLRRTREREDTRNRAAAAEATQVKEANIRQKRLEGGSRFNLRYRPAVPFDALTPESIMRALADYLDFSVAMDDGRQAPQPNRDELRKGLTVEEVDALLGRPETIDRRQEGTLTVSTSIYRTKDRIVTAEFVEGVLIRFTSSSP